MGAKTGCWRTDVRLGQVVAAKGDEIWYEYDFGDGWEHRLRVVEVSESALERARCTAGRMACPTAGPARAVSALLHDLGWRDSGHRDGLPRADGPTLEVLDHLAGSLQGRHGRGGADEAVAATARAVVRRELVGLTGLEPVTSSLSGKRSNRLSYRPVSDVVRRPTRRLPQREEPDQNGSSCLRRE